MAVIKKGLYYSYIITSQFYSVARLISNSSGFNKPDIVVELVDNIIDVEYYIGGNTSFYITNYC